MQHLKVLKVSRQIVTLQDPVSNLQMLHTSEFFFFQFFYSKFKTKTVVAILTLTYFSA